MNKIKLSKKKAVLCSIFDTVIPREYQATVPISRQQIQGLLAYSKSQSNFPQSRINHTVDTDKCKSFPLQAGSGPDGSRKLKFPDFIKSAQDSGNVVSLTHRPP